MIRSSNWTIAPIVTRYIFRVPRQWGDCYVDDWQEYADYFNGVGTRRREGYIMELFQHGLIPRELAVRELLGEVRWTE